MGVTLGRLREDSIFDYLFVALSHNTARGAAGGAILTDAPSIRDVIPFPMAKPRASSSPR